ncbi:hypothetical protein UN67_17900 [Vibrio cholerae O1 biovar El Tor]|nr:hypothetical protein UN67_17900 [Vibrio cholerae O1 biovar El Tor]
MAQRGKIPVIDLFAGPGGLCEGFSSVVDASGAAGFAVNISIEKDPVAHRTLLLRAIFRKFLRVKSQPATTTTSGARFPASSSYATLISRSQQRMLPKRPVTRNWASLHLRLLTLGYEKRWAVERTGCSLEALRAKPTHSQAGRGSAAKM